MNLEFTQFQLLQQIGTGSFGKVFRATHLPTGQQCAIKRIDLESSDDDIEEIQHEIQILAACHDTHITRYFGCFMHEFELWIVMEYLGGGSCLDLVKDLRPSTLPESAIAEILYSVVEGLAYLHQSGKIHRDIKAANVLLAETGHVKIADFGVAAQLSNNLSRRNTFVGTPFWMAPEVIDQLDYTFSADIWSLGITAIELAAGKPPLSNLHPMKALFSIPRQPPPRLSDRFSPDFKDFVEQCLQSKPQSRSSVDQLRKHRFLAKRSRQELLAAMRQRPEPEISDLSDSTAGSVEDSTNTSLLTVTNTINETVDDWDFGTVKPQPSLEQILKNPPQEVQAAPVPKPVKEYRDITHNTITNEPRSLAKIFGHAAQKFHEPVLEEICDLLRSDPLTVSVENYLVKRIGRQSAGQPKQPGFDAVEQILFEKWLQDAK